jgi:hypothetical protein
MSGVHQKNYTRPSASRRSLSVAMLNLSGWPSMRAPLRVIPGSFCFHSLVPGLPNFSFKTFDSIFSEYGEVIPIYFAFDRRDKRRPGHPCVSHANS